MHHRFAHRLARDSACIYAGAAEQCALLDDGHATAAFSPLDGGALARWPGAYDDQIVATHEFPQYNLDVWDGFEWVYREACFRPRRPCRVQVLLSADALHGTPHPAVLTDFTRSGSGADSRDGLENLQSKLL